MMALSITHIIVPILLMAGLGLFFGILLAVLAKVFYVKEDVRVETLTSMLPGYNCGACGYPGCNGLAKAIIDKKATVDSCKPSKPDQKQAIREWLDSLPKDEKL
ncbi:MAG: (Fe-S)-binding protein [Bacilli bacterium]